MQTLKAFVRGYLFLPKQSLSSELVSEIYNTFKVENPSARTLRRLYGDSFSVPDYLFYARNTTVAGVGKCLMLPRETVSIVRYLALSLGYDLNVLDFTAEGKSVEFKGELKLRDYQQEALEAARKARGGIIVAPPGSGKTVIGLAIAQLKGKRTVWLAHTKELVDQAVQRLFQFFDLKGGDVGVIGSGKFRIGKKITVATVQTLFRGVPRELLETTGTVILDEAHHAPANTFEDVVSRFPGRFRFGLTATPNRADGLTSVMYWTIGPQLFYVPREVLHARGYIILPRIKVVHTGFSGNFINSRTGKPDYSSMVKHLVEDENRNKLIINTVVQDRDHYTLVLSGRKKHCVTLYNMLRYTYPDLVAAVLTSSTPAPKRKEIMNDLVARRLRVVFATNIAEEGLDVSHLDRLHLVTPSKNLRRLTQTIGRIMRPCEDKQDAVVYDYLDDVPLAKHHFRERLSIYEEELGVSVQDGYY